MSKLLALALLLSSTACAILPEHVDVAYAPDPAVTRVQIPHPADIRLDVTDKRRAETPDWIADKKNGYGLRLANVLAQRPVTEIVRDALAQELTARGFRVGDAGNTASVEVSRLESVFQNRFFSIGAIGYSDLSVQVRRPDGSPGGSPGGSIVYARNFSVDNDDEASPIGTAGQARRSVERVLAKIVGQVVSDPAFIQALSGTPRTT